MGVLRVAVYLILYTVLAAASIVVLPGIPPNLTFDAFTLPIPRALEGKLAPNDILDKAVPFIDGGFPGPETLALRGNEIFAGIDGGYIVRVDEVTGEWKKIVRLVENCVNNDAQDGTYQSRCSRPMGLRFNPSGKLIVSDAYFGIFEVDVDTGKAKLLLSSTDPLADGVPVNYLNDVEVDKDGIIYFSDTSKTAKFHNVFVEGLGDPTGRLVRFDPKNKKSEVLMDNVHYANGIQLSKNEDFLVFVESVKARLWKYYLKGPNKGTKEIFIDRLPGVPDNVRSNGKGGFYICMVFPDTIETPSAFRQLGPLPPLRKLIIRTQNIMLQSLEMLDSYFPNDLFKSAYDYVGHLGPVGSLENLPRKGLVVNVDENGNIIGSLQSKDSQIGFISDMEIGQKYAYFGSPYVDKLWRIKKEYL